MDKIDIVLPWVDPLDIKWQEQFAKYKQVSSDIDNRDSRYRDWNNIKYIFRGIEYCMPWVNKVFFITSGHFPTWLNLENEKLVFVRHEDYIPEEYLPTFSSHPIELNLHRIENLSEHFIYFNDDMFVLNAINSNMFFKSGKPVYPAILHANTSSDKSEVMQHIYVNNNIIINSHFDIKDVISNKRNWFSLTNNGFRSVIENLFNSKYPQIIGFYNSHLPTPFLKSTLKEVWDIEYDKLNITSNNRFRSKEDVSQYLFRYWSLASNNFYPINPKKLGKEIDIEESNIDIICDVIKNRKYNMICLNDILNNLDDKQFELLKKKINDSFETVYPKKSSFEK